MQGENDSMVGVDHRFLEPMVMLVDDCRSSGQQVTRRSGCRGEKTISDAKYTNLIVGNVAFLLSSFRTCVQAARCGVMMLASISSPYSATVFSFVSY